MHLPIAGGLFIRTPANSGHLARLARCISRGVSAAARDAAREEARVRVLGLVYQMTVSPGGQFELGAPPKDGISNIVFGSDRSHLVASSWDAVSSVAHIGIGPANDDSVVGRLAAPPPPPA